MLNGNDQISFRVKTDEGGTFIWYLGEFGLFHRGRVELIDCQPVTTGDIDEPVRADGDIHRIVQAGSHHVILSRRRIEAVEFSLGFIVIPVIPFRVKCTLPYGCAGFFHFRFGGNGHVGGDVPDGVSAPVRKPEGAVRGLVDTRRHIGGGTGPYAVNALADALLPHDGGNQVFLIGNLQVIEYQAFRFAGRRFHRNGVVAGFILGQYDQQAVFIGFQHTGGDPADGNFVLGRIR